jgi:hypothetical protein
MSVLGVAWKVAEKLSRWSALWPAYPWRDKLAGIGQIPLGESRLQFIQRREVYGLKAPTICVRPVHGRGYVWTLHEREWVCHSYKATLERVWIRRRLAHTTW